MNKKPLDNFKQRISQQFSKLADVSNRFKKAQLKDQLKSREAKKIKPQSIQDTKLDGESFSKDMLGDPLSNDPDFDIVELMNSQPGSGRSSKKDPSVDFAQLLYSSYLPKKLKDEIIQNLYRFDQGTIDYIYSVLKKEQSRKKLLVLTFEIELNKILKQ